MSLRSSGILVALSFVFACGGGPQKVDPDEPKNAKEKQALEAKEEGDTDKGNAQKWGKWRYAGDRNDCFYVVGRRCFKTENAACQAARCKAPKKCDTVGGGPATVSCK